MVDFKKMADHSKLRKEIEQSTKKKLSDIARKRFSKKVIDKKSGRIYNSVTEAAQEIGLSRAYLSRQLLGIENKKHHLEYLVD